MMQIIGKDKHVFKVLAFPDKKVIKGEYLSIEDPKSSVCILVQVIDIDYVETPGLLEELIREGLFNSNKPNDIDPYNVAKTAMYLRDVKILTCVARGLVKGGSLNERIDELPSRAQSKIRKIPSSEALRMAADEPRRTMFLGMDLSHHRIELNVESINGVLTLITGMKGTGKSHLAKLLLLELSCNGAPVLVFDLNGEYVGLTKDRRGVFGERVEIDVYRPGENFFFTLNYLGLEAVSSLLTHVLNLPGVSMAVFKEIWSLVARSRSVTLEGLQEAVKRTVTNMMVKDALMSRLLTLKSSGFFVDEEAKLIKIEDIVRARRASIIVIRDLTPMARRILVEIILSKVVSLLERDRIMPFFLFAEEAHIYVRQTYWEDIVTRMRHLGLFVIFVTNQPDALDQQVFRQLDNIFLFCFKNDHDLDMVSRVSDVDSESIKSMVRDLPRGVCLSIGKAVSSLPTLISIRDLEVEAMGKTRTVFGNIESFVDELVT